MFEGEYLNGKKWKGKGYDNLKNLVYELNDGKGYIKKCWFNDVLFEGEYLNCERNGKGKEYDYDSTLIFEGEYSNDKKNGKGKEYNENGKLEFEGEYLNNFKIKGKYYINEKLEYEGEYLYNKNGMEKDMMKRVILYMN